MTNALTKAFADSSRSYLSAKASIGVMTESMLSAGPSGLPMHRPDLFNSAEQLRHFRGWVYSAIRPIAQKIAGQPIHVGRRRTAPGGKKNVAGDIEPLEDHEILRLLADPNDLQVAWSLMFVTVASLELTGRQLWWLPKREQIMPIPTPWLRGFEGSTKITTFKVQPPHSGEVFPIPAEECVYFSYPHPGDPHAVCAPLQAVAGAVNSDEAIVESQNAMFSRGIHPSHVVLVGKNPDSNMRPQLTGSQQRQIISAIRKRYSGTHNHGEPLILDGLIEDVKKLSHSPSEMDWLSSGESTKQRILQGFGVNETIIGSKESNRASASAAEKHFVDFTINPKIELLSQTMTEWFKWIFQDDSIVVWIEPCQANDADMDFKWITLLANKGAVTGDELRELSPFDLKLGSFKEPVSANGRDPAVEAVADAVHERTQAMAVLSTNLKSLGIIEADINAKAEAILRRI